MSSNRILPFVFAAALVGAVGCSVPKAALISESPDCVSVKSPDGRNEIRLYEAPMRVEALRDGVVLVPPTEIDLKVDGQCLAGHKRHVRLIDRSGAGSLATPVYKRASVDLARGEALADFGDWGVALVARNDGVAYRFETRFSRKIRIDDERVDLSVPADAKCWVNRSGGYGCEEVVSETCAAKDLAKLPDQGLHVYLPLAYSIAGKTVALTESDVCDYPILNFKPKAGGTFATLTSDFARWPKGLEHKREKNGWSSQEVVPTGGRWVFARASEPYLLETEGTRTLPWRAFILADKPSDLPAADIVHALARPQVAGDDFAWVKPGKVAWDWWNCFDNGAGCNTKTYERFIDFAAKKGVEYVIFDEGWSESLNIWKFHKDVDVPHLIDYANKKGVGIILWMAWAQVYGDEEKVASHFAKLGAKGFKVDFMDRGDAEVEQFLWKFAEACRKNRMLIDYHGAHHPTGMSRAYPNILNYEGIFGLEQMKFFGGQDIVANDVRECYLRMSAGPMDYTPGAMINYAPGTYPKNPGNFPGSLGTRSRQMAMMALFEAPLQMLCDSPTNYEKNDECFSFMSKTPVVWNETVALGGTPDTYVALARQAKDGAWYVACIGNTAAHEVAFDTAFLGDGKWRAEVFRDGPDSATKATTYVHEKLSVTAGEKLKVALAPAGGFVMRFSK